MLFVLRIHILHYGLRRNTAAKMQMMNKVRLGGPIKANENFSKLIFASFFCIITFYEMIAENIRYISLEFSI